MELNITESIVKYLESGRELTPLIILLLSVLLLKLGKGLLDNNINIFANFTNLKELREENARLELCVKTLNKEITDYDNIVELLLEQFNIYESDIAHLTSKGDSASTSLVVFQAMVDALMDYGNLDEKAITILQGLSNKLEETIVSLTNESREVREHAHVNTELMQDIINKLRKIRKEDE